MSQDDYKSCNIWGLIHLNVRASRSIVAQFPSATMSTTIIARVCHTDHRPSKDHNLVVFVVFMTRCCHVVMLILDLVSLLLCCLNLAASSTSISQPSHTLPGSLALSWHQPSVKFKNDMTSQPFHFSHCSFMQLQTHGYYLSVLSRYHNPPLVLRQKYRRPLLQGMHQCRQSSICEILFSSNFVQVVFKLDRNSLHVVFVECRRHFGVAHGFLL